MEEPLTEELLEELLVSPDPAQFARKHRIAEKGLSEYLNELLESKGLARIDVIREAGLNETFGYRDSSSDNAILRATRCSKSHLPCISTYAKPIGCYASPA